MTHNFAASPPTATQFRDGPSVVQFATCGLCHTRASLTLGALDAGGAWRCVRCGQHWDATRLAAVAAYATWVFDRDAGQAEQPMAAGFLKALP